MYLVQTNSIIRPAIRYVTREGAEARRPAWEAHYASIGMRLESFDVVEFDVMDETHHSKNGRTLIIQADGSMEFLDAKPWDKKTGRWAEVKKGDEEQTPLANVEVGE